MDQALEPDRLLLNTIVGWLIFLVIYQLAWDATVTRTLQASEPFAAAASKEAPVPRSVLWVVGVYAACRTTLLLSLSFLLLFCLMRAVQCVLRVSSGGVRWAWLIDWMRGQFLPDAMFAAVRTPSSLSFHGAVFCSSVALATVYSTVYVSDRDAASPDGVRSTVARMTLAMPVVGCLAYCGFACACAAAARRGLTVGRV